MLGLMGQLVRTLMFGVKLDRATHRKLFEEGDRLHEWNEGHRPKQMLPLTVDESFSIVGIFLVDPEGEEDPVNLGALMTESRQAGQAREALAGFRVWLEGLDPQVFLEPSDTWLVRTEIA